NRHSAVTAAQVTTAPLTYNKKNTGGLAMRITRAHGRSLAHQHFQPCSTNRQLLPPRQSPRHAGGRWPCACGTQAARAQLGRTRCTGRLAHALAGLQRAQRPDLQAKSASSPYPISASSYLFASKSSTTFTPLTP